MPGSSTKGKLTISHWYKNIPAKKYILDVGPGWGTYSHLLRSRGEVWHAVEIHEPYVERFNLKNYYQEIFVTDILGFKPRQKYDVTILGDILEHLTNRDGIQALKQILSYSRYCIISLPLDAETHASSENSSDYWQNQHEQHQAKWSNKSFLGELLSMPCEVLAVEKYYELGVYLTASSRTFFRERPASPFEWFAYHFTNHYLNYEHNSLLKRINNKWQKIIRYTK